MSMIIGVLEFIGGVIAILLVVGVAEGIGKEEKVKVIPAEKFKQNQLEHQEELFPEIDIFFNGGNSNDNV